MGQIINPILRGFNPDPSIIRVGDDYYIATSTFEWFPGVQIHYSKDLIHWKPVAHPLNRLSQLNMAGIDSSCGVWAPNLSYDRGTFYLIYTIVRSTGGIFKDTLNFLVTAADIQGEWSEPIFLNASGFDPSLFHDDDGRKWLVNMDWNHGQGKKRFGGILLQEYAPVQKRLVGPVQNIFQHSGLAEGPNLYKRDDYYYLMLAEGGTGLNHSVWMARSKSIAGPYETDLKNPILTAREDPRIPLQKAGHASLVHTPSGEWYMAHLCGRPIPASGRCTLGRETCIQKVIWSDDGWLRLAQGGNKPLMTVPGPDLPEYPFPQESVKDDFDSEKLGIHFQTLRVPLGEEYLSLIERPGYLRLKGGESLNSRYFQSLIARRQQAFCYTATACMEFEPESYKQMAGLICIYDIHNYFYLRVSHDGTGKCLAIINCDNGTYNYPLEKDIYIGGDSRHYLQARVDYDRLRFYYSSDGEQWLQVGGNFDYSRISDEGINKLAFTGAMIGICCQDLSGMRKHADFDYFEYIERDFAG
ncbi:MAG TPA: glycoside hydrolase family 43 protein [Bacillota bacterium]